MIFVVWAIAGVVIAFGFTAFLGAPYLPSRQRDIEKAFEELCPLKTSDVVLDLGAGDGAVLLAVAKRGAKAVGYEIHPLLVLIARFRLRHFERTEVVFANLWRKQFPGETTLVYLFSDSRDIAKMYRKINNEARRLGRPLLILSYGFEIPGALLLKKNKSYFLYTTQPLQSEES